MAPLWTPSAERIERARLTQFMRHVAAQRGTAIHDYEQLYDFSISRPEDFWRAVWDFCAVIGERGERVAIGMDRMPGAEFFPDARLNFAENVLRQRGKVPRDLQWREPAPRTSVTTTSSRSRPLRSALRAAGSGWRSRRRLSPQHARGDHCGARRCLDRRRLVLVLAGLRVQGLLDRSARSSRASHRRGWILLRRQDPRHPPACDRGLAALPTVERVVIVPYVEMEPSVAGIRDGITWTAFIDGHDSAAGVCALPFNHPLYILYPPARRDPEVHRPRRGGTLIQHLKETPLHLTCNPGIASSISRRAAG